MRKRLRNAFAWLSTAVASVLVLGVGGEWVIEVARDKGLYQDAGSRFDWGISVMSDWLLSPLATHLMVLLFGVTAGMWIDYLLRKKEAATPSYTYEAANADEISIYTTDGRRWVAKITFASRRKDVVLSIRRESGSWHAGGYDWSSPEQDTIARIAAVESGDTQHHAIVVERAFAGRTAFWWNREDPRLISAMEHRCVLSVRDETGTQSQLKFIIPQRASDSDPVKISTQADFDFPTAIPSRSEVRELPSPQGTGSKTLQ